MNININVKSVFRFFFNGYSSRLESHMVNKTPTTLGIGGVYYQGLYIIDYDKHFIVLSDDGGIIVTYNRDSVESFTKTVYEESGPQNPQ